MSAYRTAAPGALERIEHRWWWHTSHVGQFWVSHQTYARHHTKLYVPREPWVLVELRPTS